MHNQKIDGLPKRLEPRFASTTDRLGFFTSDLTLGISATVLSLQREYKDLLGLEKEKKKSNNK